MLFWLRNPAGCQGTRASCPGLCLIGAEKCALFSLPRCVPSTLCPAQGLTNAHHHNVTQAVISVSPAPADGLRRSQWSEFISAAPLTHMYAPDCFSAFQLRSCQGLDGVWDVGGFHMTAVMSPRCHGRGGELLAVWESLGLFSDCQVAEGAFIELLLFVLY